MTTERTDITIVSDDLPLAGWLYRPDAAELAGAVVMAHGFGAVKELGLDAFARSFAEAGLVVVVFDHPCFGASGGTPRQEVNPERQLRAFRDAITWTSGLAGVDPARIGVWGTSFSGGHAIVTAANDDRVAAAVAQVPYLRAPAEDIPEELAQILTEDEKARRKGADPITIPITTDDPGGFGALSPDPDAHAWFTGTAAPSWRNEVTLLSIARLFAYRPLESAASVTVPTLVIGAEDDVLCPIGHIHEALERLGEHGELLTVPGGHFDVYEKQFDQTVAAATSWFTRWLSP